MEYILKWPTMSGEKYGINLKWTVLKEKYGTDLKGTVLCTKKLGKTPGW